MPCNGCTRCCINDAVRILPHEDASRWHTEPHPVDGWRMLAHKRDGACHYLGETGCTIHDTKPEQCNTMDCRAVSLAIGYTQARHYGIVHVWRRGRELLKGAR